MTDGRWICVRRVSDTTIPNVRFDERGECNFCKVQHDRDRLYPLDERGQARRDRVIERVERTGQGKVHGCAVGTGAGTDRTYTLCLAKRVGLRPLGVHLPRAARSLVKVASRAGQMNPVLCQEVLRLMVW